ncbi:hypothetical protein [Haloechinothrix salitolerans]|uniref:Uncharacterized protein n=1 Tax=Haloechinothrix salitolerans TaxID=926830 RepID=A0ABW2C780_9PSEU
MIVAPLGGFPQDAPWHARGFTSLGVCRPVVKACGAVDHVYSRCCSPNRTARTYSRNNTSRRDQHPRSHLPKHVGVSIRLLDLVPARLRGFFQRLLVVDQTSSDPGIREDYQRRSLG